MGLLYKDPMEFHYETGRVLDDIENSKPTYYGSVGTSFCSDLNHDRKILENLKVEANKKGKNHICDMIDLQLDYGGLM